MKRKYFDVEENWGYIEFEVGDARYRFEVHKDGKRYIVKFGDLWCPLRSLKKLLKVVGGKELVKYSDIIEIYIKSMIHEARTKASRYRYMVIDVKKIPIGSKELRIGIGSDGKLVIRYGREIRVVDFSPEAIKEAVADLIPFDEYTPEVAEQIKEVIESINEGIVKGEDVVILSDSEERCMLLLTEVVDDRLITVVPFVSRYTDGYVVKRGLLVLTIFSNSRGEVEKLSITKNPTEIEVLGKTIYVDLTRNLGSYKCLEPFLPSKTIVLELKREIEGGSTISWSEALELVERFIDRYAYVGGRNKIKAVFYAIAQFFFDTITIFPILRIIGESGSGKRQLSNAIASASPYYMVVTDPSYASVYTIAEAIHPTLVIDETKINEDMARLLNKCFEKKGFVTRVVQLKNGKRIVEAFHTYTPIILVTRPGKLDLPQDTISRIVDVYIQRIVDRVFPPEIEENERKEVVTKLLLLKIRRWREFLDAYNMLRNTLVGIDQRTRDTYLPLLTVAYLVAKESGNTKLFEELLMDLAETAEERAGVEYHQRVAINGILKHIVKERARQSSLKGRDVVRIVTITVKNIEDALGEKLDSGIKSKIGKFLSEAPFKIAKVREKGHTKYRIDIAKLNEYVKTYGVALELNDNDKELEELERITGLSWSFARPEPKTWAKNVVSKLFGNNNENVQDKEPRRQVPHQDLAEQHGNENVQDKELEEDLEKVREFIEEGLKRFDFLQEGRGVESPPPPPTPSTQRNKNGTCNGDANQFNRVANTIG